MTSCVLLLFAFSGWAFYKKGASSRGKAIRALKGKQSKDEDKDRFVGKGSVVLARYEDVEVEMNSKSRRSCLFESTNPMARDKGRGEEGGVGKSQCKKSN